MIKSVNLKMNLMIINEWFEWYCKLKKLKITKISLIIKIKLNDY